MLVVTINYRLAALGFYASESIGDATINTTGAMNGVLDVVRALKFVHNHIR
jgi:carboxylesterase type B